MEELRSLPCSLEAEKSVLGAILLKPLSLLDVKPLLEPEDFYSLANKLIYKGFLALDSEKTPIDSLTLRNELEKRSELSQVGGEYYISTLMIDVSSPENARAYANIVKNKSKLRSIIIKQVQLVDRCYLAETDWKEALSDTTSELDKIRDQTDNNIITSDVNYVENRFRVLKERAESKHVGTGYLNLDQFLYEGLAKRRIVLLASRPSIGKTAFKINIIRNLCEQGFGIASFSPETDFLGESDRLDSIITGIPGEDLIRAKPGASFTDTLVLSAEKISNWNYHFINKTRLGLGDVRLIVKDLKRRYRIDVVFIDLFSNLYDILNFSGTSKVDNIDAKLQETRDLAEELDVCMFLLHHVARDIDKRKDKRPQLSDLRGSGGYEQICDTVMFLYRDKFYRKELLDDIADIIVAKQRYGPVNETAYLKVDMQTGKFSNIQDNRII